LSDLITAKAKSSSLYAKDPSNQSNKADLLSVVRGGSNEDGVESASSSPLSSSAPALTTSSTYSSPEAKSRVHRETLFRAPKREGHDTIVILGGSIAGVLSAKALSKMRNITIVLVDTKVCECDYFLLFTVLGLS